MPLFKRRGRQAPSPGDDPDPAASRVLSEAEILDRLEEEIVRAERYDRPLVVLCALPQRISTDEQLEPEETAAATETVCASLRFTDRVGTLTDGTIVAILPETLPDMARTVAYRVADGLTRRGAAAGRRKWLVGTSAFPLDGADPPAMVTAAIRRAQST